MFRLNKKIWLTCIPIALSWVTVHGKSVLLFILFVLAHFIIMGIVPAFRKRENVWMFILVAVTSIPINIFILLQLNRIDMLFNSLFVLGVLRCVLYYSVLFSIEEIIMGLITRLLWKKQYKINFGSE